MTYLWEELHHMAHVILETSVKHLEGRPFQMICPHNFVKSNFFDLR